MSKDLRNYLITIVAASAVLVIGLLLLHSLGAGAWAP